MAKKQKCNCGKRATSEYLVVNKNKKQAHTLYFCAKCKPTRNYEGITLIT